MLPTKQQLMQRFPVNVQREELITRLDKNRYYFRSDWFSSQVWHWNRILKRFVGKDNLTFLEVGSFEGRATLYMCEYVLTGRNCKMHCVDLFGEDGKKSLEHELDDAKKLSAIQLLGTFKHNLRHHMDKVVAHVGNSQVILPQLHEQGLMCDFIYIDGSHLAYDTLYDMVSSDKILKPGGIMIVDDYNWKFNDFLDLRYLIPATAIAHFLKRYEYDIVTQYYQIALRKPRHGQPPDVSDLLRKFKAKQHRDVTEMLRRKARFEYSNIVYNRVLTDDVYKLYSHVFELTSSSRTEDNDVRYDIRTVERSLPTWQVGQPDIVDVPDLQLPRHLSRRLAKVCDLGYMFYLNQTIHTAFMMLYRGEFSARKAFWAKYHDRRVDELIAFQNKMVGLLSPNHVTFAHFGQPFIEHPSLKKLEDILGYMLNYYFFKRVSDKLAKSKRMCIASGRHILRDYLASVQPDSKIDLFIYKSRKVDDAFSIDDDIGLANTQTQVLEKMVAPYDCVFVDFYTHLTSQNLAHSICNESVLIPIHMRATIFGWALTLLRRLNRGGNLVIQLNAISVFDKVYEELLFALSRHFNRSQIIYTNLKLAMLSHIHVMFEGFQGDVDNLPTLNDMHTITSVLHDDTRNLIDYAKYMLNLNVIRQTVADQLDKYWWLSSTYVHMLLALDDADQARLLKVNALYQQRNGAALAASMKLRVVGTIDSLVMSEYNGSHSYAIGDLSGRSVENTRALWKRVQRFAVFDGVKLQRNGPFPMFNPDNLRRVYDVWRGGKFVVQTSVDTKQAMPSTRVKVASKGGSKLGFDEFVEQLMAINYKIVVQAMLLVVCKKYQQKFHTDDR